MKSKKVYYFSVFCVLFLAILAIQARPCGAEQPSALSAEVKMQPDSFNLKHKWGSRLTCVISFPEWFDIANVNKDEIMLENEIKAESAILLPNLVMARFNRGDVLRLLERKTGDPPVRVNLLVSGTTNGGIPFKAQGKVSVTSPPKIDLALKKEGEKVTVVVMSDEKLNVLRVFAKEPPISSYAPVLAYGRKTIPVETNYEKGDESGYRYVGNFDTSSFRRGEVTVVTVCTDLDNERAFKRCSLKIR